MVKRSTFFIFGLSESFWLGCMWSHRFNLTTFFALNVCIEIAMRRVWCRAVILISKIDYQNSTLPWGSYWIAPLRWDAPPNPSRSSMGILFACPLWSWCSTKPILFLIFSFIIILSALAIWSHAIILHSSVVKIYLVYESFLFQIQIVKNHEVPSKNQLVISGVTHVLIYHSLLLFIVHVGLYTPISPLKMVAIFFFSFSLTNLETPLTWLRCGSIAR